MRLTRFIIRNHSRIQDCEVQVHEHLVVVGANDVGKTSLLRCLHLALGASYQQLLQSLTPSDLRDLAFPMTVTVTLEAFSDDDRALFTDEIAVGPDESESLTIELVVETLIDDPDQVQARRHFPGKGDRQPRREQLEQIGWRYLPASRSGGVEFMEGPRSSLRAMLNAAPLGADKEELTNALAAFNSLLTTNDALSSLRTQIADHLSRAMPRTMTADDLMLRTTTDPSADVLSEVSLFVADEGQSKALTEHSDGLRQLMAMTFFDLAQSTANIVAIDEPELHLHASSQRTIADLFANGASQRVLVTHSPYIVQRFEPRHILAVAADRTVRQVPLASFDAVEKEQANWWAPTLLEALTARHALIVEGAADRILVEAAARVHGLSLDRIGVSILELGGAEKFKHVYKLLGEHGFRLDVLGLVDYNERGSWMHNLKIKERDLNTSPLFVCTADLEDDYAVGVGGPSVARALIAEGVCREQSVLEATRASTVEVISPSAIAQFCRGRKVEAAVAVGKHLTPEAVDRMPTTSLLITHLKTL